MNKPRKHAEVIKAWADGQDVQFLNLVTNKWSDISNPTWRSDREYRVKPQKKKITVAVVLYNYGRDELRLGSVSSANFTEDYLIKDVEKHHHKVLHSQTIEIEVEDV